MRMLAEWEEQTAVLMALPKENSDWEPILPLAEEQYKSLISAMTANEVKVVLLCDKIERAAKILADCNQDMLMYVEAEYNDTWTRDYGPIAIEKNGRLRSLDFGFNGWGLKFAADKDNLVNLQLSNKGLVDNTIYINCRDFVLEGGSIDCDGDGTILTTTRCLCSPNRNGGKSKAEISEILSRKLGASHILWLDYGALQGDDTDSHIDTLARIAPDNTILFTGCRDVDDPHFEELLHLRAQLTMFRSADGNRFNLIELPLPEAIYAPDGERLPATYANYLITNHVIFMPTYNQLHTDQLAAQTLKVAFPGHRIVGVDCRTLLRQHGSLHCATMQLYPQQLEIF